MKNDIDSNVLSWHVLDISQQSKKTGLYGSSEKTIQDDIRFVSTLVVPFLVGIDIVWLYIDVFKWVYIGSYTWPLSEYLFPDNLNRINFWCVKSEWNFPRSFSRYRNVNDLSFEILHNLRDRCRRVTLRMKCFYADLIYDIRVLINTKWTSSNMVLKDTFYDLSPPYTNLNTDVVSFHWFSFFCVGVLI